jgi:hypothetical protein
MNQVSFWCRGIAEVFEEASYLAISASNQFLETIIRNAKYCRDIYATATSLSLHNTHNTDGYTVKRVKKCLSSSWSNWRKKSKWN